MNERDFGMCVWLLIFIVFFFWEVYEGCVYSIYRRVFLWVRVYVFFYLGGGVLCVCVGGFKLGVGFIKVIRG